MICSWQSTKSLQRRRNGSNLSMVHAHCFWVIPLLHSNYNVKLISLNFCLILYIYINVFLCFWVAVALSYSLQIVEEGDIAVTFNDVPVDALVSPAGYIPISQVALDG